MRPLGVSGSAGIAKPFTEEAVAAIEASSEIKTIETSLYMFAHDFHSPIQQKFTDVVRKKGIATPTFHATFGAEYDMSSLDPEVRKSAIEKFYAELLKARELNAEIIVLHPSSEPISDAERKDRIKCLRLSMAEIEERLNKYGYRVALELLPRTCLGNTPKELWEIVEDFDETFGFCFDVNHMMDRIDDIPRATRLLGRRLYALHISDYFGVDEEHLLPGTGDIDWKKFIEALDEVGFKGPLNYELKAVALPGPPLENIRAIEENYKTIFC